MADLSQQMSIGDEALKAFAAESGMTKLMLMEANARVSSLTAEKAALLARVAELEQAVEAGINKTVADAGLNGAAAGK